MERDRRGIQSIEVGGTLLQALVRHGTGRMGQVLEFPLPSGEVLKGRICDPVFYDKEGARLNG